MPQSVGWQPSTSLDNGIASSRPNTSLRVLTLGDTGRSGRSPLALTFLLGHHVSSRHWESQPAPSYALRNPAAGSSRRPVSCRRAVQQWSCALGEGLGTTSSLQSRAGRSLEQDPEGQERRGAAPCRLISPAQHSCVQGTLLGRARGGRRSAPSTAALPPFDSERFLLSWLREALFHVCVHGTERRCPPRASGGCCEAVPSEPRRRGGLAAPALPPVPTPWERSRTGEAGPASSPAACSCSGLPKARGALRRAGRGRQREGCTAGPCGATSRRKAQGEGKAGRLGWWLLARSVGISPLLSVAETGQGQLQLVTLMGCSFPHCSLFLGPSRSQRQQFLSGVGHAAPPWYRLPSWPCCFWNERLQLVALVQSFHG